MGRVLLFLLTFNFIQVTEAQNLTITIHPLVEGKPCKTYSYMDSTFLNLLDSEQVVRLNSLLTDLGVNVSSSELISFSDALKYTITPIIKKTCYSYGFFSTFDNVKKSAITISYNGFAKQFKVPKISINLVKSDNSDEYKIFIYQFRGAEL